MLLTSSWLLDVTILLVTIAFLSYKYSTRKFDYWKKRGVYYVKPTPFVGNFGEVCLLKTTPGEWLQKLYDAIDKPYFGIFIFSEPILVIKSPELVKEMIVKDSSTFINRYFAVPEHNKTIANLIFAQRSTTWKVIRSKVSPVFSSGKLKGMFHLLGDISDELNRYLEKHTGDIEAKEISAKYSVEVIGKCFFGINSHSIETEDAEFRKVGSDMFRFTLRNALAQISYFFVPQLVQILHLDFLERRITNYLTELFIHVSNERKKTGSKYNDFVDHLIELQEDKKFCNDIDFTGERIFALPVQVFLAGYETTSSTIAFTLYELCKNHEIQNKLRNEIMENIKKHQGLTYQGVCEMQYLELCLLEILRMYPVLPFLDRICSKDYKLPGSDIVIEKNTPVYIPMFGFHYDEKYFPEPRKYIPERFLDAKSQQASHFFPFGVGPRFCIGERFGSLSVKVALASILSQYELERSSLTPDFIEFEPKIFFLTSKVGLPMRLKKIVPAHK